MKEILFMRCVGRGSPALYSGELAKRLSKYSHIEIKDINIPFKSYLEIGSWIQYILRHREKVYHFPFQHYAKFVLFADTSIVSVHDMWGFEDPIFPDVKGYIYRKMDNMGIKKATHIITPSDFSKKQIVKYLPIDPEKITTVYNGLNHDLFRPVKSLSPLPFDYILFVGSEQPRKNFKTLLESLKILKEKKEFKNLKLVKIGSPEKQNFRDQSLKEIKELGLTADVIFTGYIKDKDLPVYYSNAKCYISPSICEGFGLPTVEAMACGCPVITSNTSAFPEIVGTAGLLRDPFDAAGFAEDLEKIIQNDELRKVMIDRGLARAKIFSWDMAAEKIERIYNFFEN
jgi:glycosyltransferase involved in cell wall biosynthesis